MEASRRHFAQRVEAGHPWLPLIKMRMAEAFIRAGQPRDALASAQQALEVLGADNVRRADAELVEGAALAALGRHGEAEPILERAVVAVVATMPENAWRLAWARLELAECRAALGRPAPLGEDWPRVRETLEARRGAEDVLSQRARQLEEFVARARSPKSS